MRRTSKCTYRFEGLARRMGYEAIAGVDEVGRGCLFGPVVAAAVAFPPGRRIASGLNDSKQLTPMQRVALDCLIRIWGHYGIGSADAKYIDQFGIRAATRLAMARAVDNLPEPPDYLLVDGDMETGMVRSGPMPQRTIIHGDALCASIAAASIVAKVFRDGLMTALAMSYPGYGLERHKGYPTPEHFRALRELGVTAMHRLSFRGVLKPQEWKEPTEEFLQNYVMPKERT